MRLLAYDTYCQVPWLFAINRSISQSDIEMLMHTYNSLVAQFEPGAWVPRDELNGGPDPRGINRCQLPMAQLPCGS